MFRNPTTDLIVVLVIVLLILGPKRLPGLGKSLGQGMREFKDSISGDSNDDDDDRDKPAITRAASVADPAADGDKEPAATPARGSAEAGSERRS
jgi:sec-independent protein translocase protein TatA